MRKQLDVLADDDNDLKQLRVIVFALGRAVLMETAYFEELGPRSGISDARRVLRWLNFGNDAAALVAKSMRAASKRRITALVTLDLGTDAGGRSSGRSSARRERGRAARQHAALERKHIIRMHEYL